MNRPFPRSKLVWSLSTLVMLFLLFPIVVIVPISFSSATYLEFPPTSLSLQWYERYFGDPEWMRATWISFQVAVVVMLLSTTIGTLAAFAVVRGTFPGKTLIHGLLLSPLIVPAIITAIALYMVLAQIGLIGTPFSLIIAHTVVTFPLAMVVVTAALSGFDQRLERAALGLGASRFYAVRRVTLSILAPAIATAAALTFLTSLDEVVIAIFLAGTDATTLPKMMWEGVWLEITPTIAAASSFLILLTVLVFLIVGRLQRRARALKGEAR